MNLKLSALILFIPTLISLSASFPQEPKDDQLEEARAKLQDLAVRPAPNFNVIPVNFSDLNPYKKRDVSRLPSVILYICAEPLLKGRCEKLSSKRDHCCKCNSFLIPTRTRNTFPSHGIIAFFFNAYACATSNSNNDNTR